MPKSVFRQLSFGFGLMDIDELEGKIDQLVGELDDRGTLIKELQDRNEQLIDEVQNLEYKVDNLEEENRDFKTEIGEYKDEIKDKADMIRGLEDDIDEYKFNISGLDQIAYKAVVALYIMIRFMPEKYKDLVNIHMMMEVKDNIDHFVDESYSKILDIAYNGNENNYRLPKFDNREDVGECEINQTMPKM